MASWIVAESLNQLLAQLNAVAPHRSKASDGSIGDAAHATRDSDHNPWLVLGGQALVTARDFTNDPGGGLACQTLADALQRAKDPRVKYVIWNRRIMSGAAGPSPWVWRPYTGINPHDHHLHLSVVADARCRDRRAWTLPGLAGSAPPVSTSHATIQRGSTGPDVELIQRFLGVVGPGDAGYGTFGNLTFAAVVRYQTMRGLTPDGVVGNQTWQAIGL